MGDDDGGDVLEGAEVVLQPGDIDDVQMVCRLVAEEQISLLQPERKQNGVSCIVEVIFE